MQNTPWWGVPVVAGIFAFLGVILAQVVSVVIENGRAKREDRVRWHTQRRELYAEFLKSAIAYLDEIHRKINENDFNEKRMENYPGELLVKQLELNFIASDEVQKSAQELSQALRVANKSSSPGSDGAVLDSAIEKLLDFEDAVRGEFGLKKVSSPNLGIFVRIRQPRKMVKADTPAIDQEAPTRHASD
ncbi:hypothetical protein [Paractinoplanes lichenicola]|uniref:Uncharacterized protein n=1 Tax=Paractinoplanes lichenicola TaxID=2802976 RepID=A0ABS1VXG2_9ACTN|nr:hypothetical protein [Actinoplanes lichenicola]MBL7259154.1 hypothetical protein [Actinoplanes lichenicola]